MSTRCTGWKVAHVQETESVQRCRPVHKRFDAGVTDGRWWRRECGYKQGYRCVCMCPARPQHVWCLLGTLSTLLTHRFTALLTTFASQLNNIERRAPVRSTNAASGTKASYRICHLHIPTLPRYYKTMSTSSAESAGCPLSAARLVSSHQGSVSLHKLGATRRR